MNYLLEIIKRKGLNRRGFTLLEMLIVLLIVALLMAIIIPNVSGQRDRINTQAKTNIAEIIETQANTYKMVEADQAPTLNTLHDQGYITSKQRDQAHDLLGLDLVTPIPDPILVD
ncbi:competence type IV pilus major pilin ComGC [Hutsoniella sourekii]|uniref:competence type IV pilus major pilin ComGC n=1 Tax=Hutsoniella sourekii TaxID=87650 RepID=UPI0005548957|nr:competence type IV pilus major pilin ComGC [Hutsoniella sourekii]